MLFGMLVWCTFPSANLFSWLWRARKFYFIECVCVRVFSWCSIAFRMVNILPNNTTLLFLFALFYIFDGKFFILFSLPLSPSSSPLHILWRSSINTESLLSTETFCKIFPFHVMFDKYMQIVQVGNSVSRIIPRWVEIWNKFYPADIDFGYKYSNISLTTQVAYKIWED